MENVRLGGTGKTELLFQLTEHIYELPFIGFDSCQCLSTNVLTPWEECHVFDVAMFHWHETKNGPWEK